jgi:hypothetical protein
MAELFGRVPLQYGGAFTADAAIVTFGGPGIVGGGRGLLTQEIGFTYRQNIMRVYEIGSRFTFYVAGRSQGEGQMRRILGPRPISTAFYVIFGNPCNAYNTLIFSVAQGCLPGDNQFFATAVNFALMNVLLNTFGLTVQAEQMMINEQLQFMFITVEV